MNSLSNSSTKQIEGIPCMFAKGAKALLKLLPAVPSLVSCAAFTSM